MIKNNFKIIVFVLIFLVITNFVIAEKMDPWTDLTFFDSIDSIGFFDWGEFDSNFDPGEELNWYPLEDWEYQVCSATLTSEFFYDNDESISHVNLDGRVYDETVALNANVEKTEFTDENGKTEYLLTIGWYIQAANLNNADRTVKYKVKLNPGNYYLDLGEGETEKEFTLITGASGFFSNYTTVQYRSVDLIVDNEIYTFDVEGASEAYS